MLRFLANPNAHQRAIKQFPQSQPKYIYALEDPLLDLPFYIGETAYLQRRYRSHLLDANRAHYDISTASLAKCAYLALLAQKGLQPRMFVLEEVQSNEHMIFREMQWVLFYFTLGMPLTNHFVIREYTVLQTCLPYLDFDILNEPFGTQNWNRFVQIYDEASVLKDTISMPPTEYASVTSAKRAGRFSIEGWTLLYERREGLWKQYNRMKARSLLPFEFAF